VPSWVSWEPNQIWMYDITHFPRAKRPATAIEGVVSRKWLTTVLSVEETSTQVELAFTRALEDKGLMVAIGDRVDGRIEPDRPDGTHTPVLLARSDNGPEMTSSDTSTFMPLNLIGQHFGRPYTPEDQGWIESLFGHTKTEAPYLTKIDDPAVLRHELEARRAFYNNGCDFPRRHRLCHPQRRTRGMRSCHPQSPPRRARTGPPNPPRLRSKPP
jgi:putative transposase